MSKKKHELSALQAAHCINVGVFLVVIAIMGLAAVFLPKPTVSEYEKRELAKSYRFKENATDDEIISACKMAELHDFIIR